MFKLPSSAVAAVAAGIGLLALSAPSEAGEWEPCWNEERGCPRYYLNITMGGTSAGLKVLRTCAGIAHAWRKDDVVARVHQSPRATATYRCIPLAHRVDQIIVSPRGSHCGYHPSEIALPPNRQSGAAELWPGGPDEATFEACQAGFEMPQVQRVNQPASLAPAAPETSQFGGIALFFSDGYGMGDFRTTGAHPFYTIYEGFGRGYVKPTQAKVMAVAEYNTFQYGVDILANGSSDWRSPGSEEGRR